MGETTGRSSQLDFRAAVGSKVTNQGMKTFDNNLFVSKSGTIDFGASNASRITNTNGCLERCKDVEYYSQHSLYYKFLGMQVSL